MFDSRIVLDYEKFYDFVENLEIFYLISDGRLSAAITHESDLKVILKDPHAVEVCLKELEIPLIDNALFDQLILTICLER